MPSYTCDCGAKYRIPETSVGRKAKCKACGEVFTVEHDGGIPLAAEPEAFSALPDRRAAMAGAEGVIPARTALPDAEASAPLMARRGPALGYWDNVLWTVLFPATPSDLLTFVVIWLVMGTIGMLPLISIFVTLWYAAYRFELIANAAGGEEGLPSPVLGSDIWGDWVAPLFQWMGSWLLVLGPALAYLMVSLSRRSASTMEAIDKMQSGIPGIIEAFGSDPVLVSLIVLGLFFWPMVVLCIALGGFLAATRVDLMIITIGRLLPAYLCTIGLVAGATAVEYFVQGYASTAGPAPPGAPTPGLMQILTTALLLNFLLTGAAIYADIVSLRCIGLFYHHFKHKFAWDWGQ